MLEAFWYSHIVKPQRHNFPLIFVTDNLAQYWAQNGQRAIKGQKRSFLGHKA